MLKKGNGIFYFIIAVLLVSLGTCVFLLVKRDDPAMALSGTGFSPESKAIAVEEKEYETQGSVLGLSDDDGEKEVNKSGSVLGRSDEDSASEKPQQPQQEENKADQLSSVAQKMIQSVIGYFAASSPEEKLAYVLHPEIIEPKMNAYYSRVPMKTGKVAKINVPVGMALGGLAYWRAQGELDDGTPFFVALRVVDGKPKIDWESEVRYCDFDWDEWVDDPKAKEGEFRVYAKLDAVYEAPFTDSDRYRCLQLNVMDSSRTMFAYIDMKDFDQKEFYTHLNTSGGGPLECLLKLEKHEGKGSKISKAKVLKVLSSSWINTRTADD